MLAWATTTGLTVDELAMIQPSYSSPATPESIRREINDEVEWLTLRCASKHPSVSLLALRVVGDDDGAATVTTTNTTPFARCFASLASELERGGSAYDSKPQEYRFTMIVAIPSPQTILQKRFDASDTNVGCTPRPGPLPRIATFDLRSTSEGLVVKVVTTPHNAEVTACLERQYASWFADFGPGVWKLALRRERPLAPAMEPQNIASRTPSLATDCATAANPQTRATVSVSAKAGDKTFAITTDAEDPAFAGCLIKKLEKALRDEFTVRREVAGTHVPYFRIDADVRASANAGQLRSFVHVHVSRARTRPRSSAKLAQHADHPD
ncbi:MAG: hypothetical protein H0T42_29405, partial [Deltaproteobacteria bacterium]|nr:hypothetical protein [Deltaproteobacteria bacterium]